MVDDTERQRRDNQAFKERIGPPLANPAHWKPADLDSQELLYQVWRCLHSIRTIMIAWLVTAVVAAAAWFIVFSTAKDNLLRY